LPTPPTRLTLPAFGQAQLHLRRGRHGKVGRFDRAARPVGRHAADPDLADIGQKDLACRGDLHRGQADEALARRGQKTVVLGRPDGDEDRVARSDDTRIGLIDAADPAVPRLSHRRPGRVARKACPGDRFNGKIGGLACGILGRAGKNLALHTRAARQGAAGGKAQDQKHRQEPDRQE
jgi:hypothetical protein